MKTNRPYNWLLTGNLFDHTTTYKPAQTKKPKAAHHEPPAGEYRPPFDPAHHSCPAVIPAGHVTALRLKLWASARTPGLPMSAMAVLVQLQPHLPDCASQILHDQLTQVCSIHELGSRSNPRQVTLQPGRNLLHRLAFGRITELDMQSFSQNATLCLRVRPIARHK